MNVPESLEGPRKLRIARAGVHQMYAHAVDDVPNEACGMFGGAGERVDTVYSLANADESPYNYAIDSRDQIKTIRAAEDAGLDITGCYHSHTRTDAYPSPTDVAQALYPEWIYALLSLKYEEPVLRAYRIVDEKIVEIPVVVEA